MITLLSLWISFSSVAKDLNGVHVAEVTPDITGVRLTLRQDAGPKNSYFYIHLDRTNPTSFDTLARIAATLQRRKDSRLNLTIESFSGFPSGSRYDDARVRVREDEESSDSPDGERIKFKKR